MRNVRSAFYLAVEACSDLVYHDGLQAIVPSSKRSGIRPHKTQSLTGSVDIDNDLSNRFPHDNRWDYAVGYTGEDGVERAYFIEIHPAETSEVGCVVKKLQALRGWAPRHAPDLWNMTKPQEIHWIASGSSDIRLSDRNRRCLACEGLIPKRSLTLK